MIREAHAITIAMLIVGVAGCNALLAIDDYRQCMGAECDGSIDAASSDATPEAGVCSVSSDCTDAPAVVCSAGRCRSITTLVQGTVGYQCVILSDATMWCWGSNGSGVLGRGAIGGNLSTPAPVTVVSDPIVAAVLGNSFACAQTASGDVKCWGSGAAGSGTGSAIKVGLPTSASSIGGSSSGACAIASDNNVYCWGQNDYGDLGCDSSDAGAPLVHPSSPRLLLPAADNIAKVAPGLYGTCAYEEGLKQTVHCFGNSAWGILGDGTPAQGDTACQSSTFSGFATNQLIDIINSDFSACARDSNGYFYCWGMNWVFYGAGLIWPANPAQEFTSPFQMPLATNTMQLSLGWVHACALSYDNKVECWGLSMHGETGEIIKTNPGFNGPRTIQNINSATQIAAHRLFTCALLESGGVVCWGDNESSTIGPSSLGTNVPDPTPIVFP